MATPILQQGNVVTMSNLEIAELTGKRHDNVMADVEKMLIELGINAPEFSGTYRTSQGNKFKCFNLPRREVDVLLTGYSPPMRAAVIDRWRVLEAEVSQPQFKVPTTLHGALLLAAELEEQRATLMVKGGAEFSAYFLYPVSRMSTSRRGGLKQTRCWF
ncbi:Rha family transcriptional regulator [Pseudomonas silesiensis]|uniref:Rha family transcriptional regulator n=1 Tax=Pseudomonas silesiensis TaxID=1853130 RepID=UPI0034D42492